LLIEHAGSWWWLAAWAAFIAVQVLFALLLPVFVLPLFMKLTPVEDGDLRGRVESLLARCGVSANGVFVSDASRRTSHGNAFFAGIGATRRIVLFDTLLKDMQPGEVDGVVAHEIGHLKLRHVPKSLVAVAALAAVAFALLGWLADERWFYEGLGVDTPSRQAALLLFAIAGPLFAAVLQPLQMAMSRRFELEADDFAARYAAAEDLASGLVRMTDLSAVAIDSDPAYSAVYENHPPVGRRVARLLDGQGDGRRLTPAAGVAGGGP
jgi:STE24 endopeptidase